MVSWPINPPPSAHPNNNNANRAQEQATHRFRQIIQRKPAIHTVYPHSRLPHVLRLALLEESAQLLSGLGLPFRRHGVFEVVGYVVDRGKGPGFGEEFLGGCGDVEETAADGAEAGGHASDGGGGEGGV